MEIRTSSAEAQKHFDQGLGLLWGFNHAAAAMAFRAAQEAAPRCALCYWAEASVLGPDLNDALMNLQPWDYWEADGATPKGNGTEILATLERALKFSPKHPAALPRPGVS